MARPRNGQPLLGRDGSRLMVLVDVRDSTPTVSGSKQPQTRVLSGTGTGICERLVCRISRDCRVIRPRVDFLDQPRVHSCHSQTYGRALRAKTLPSGSTASVLP